MAMQELAYSRDEILERVNSFMEEKFFSDLQVQLLLGRHGLQNVPDGKMRGTFVRPSLPGVSGKWLKDMCPNSPIARCYKAFVEKRVSLTTEAKDGL